MFGASAQAPDATRKISRPRRVTRAASRRPARGSRASAVTTTTARLKAVTTHATPWIEAWNSPSSSGSASTTIAESAKATATATASSRARTRCGAAAGAAAIGAVVARAGSGTVTSDEALTSRRVERGRRNRTGRGHVLANP